MMTCRELVELLHDFLAQELPQDACEQVRQHLECCCHCGTFYQTYQITIRITRRLPPVAMPEGLLDKLREMMDKCSEE
jgi:hypothetical protein